MARPVPARLADLVRGQLEGDVLAFAREVFDFRDLTDELHGRLGQFLMRPGTRKLILSPRGSYKSSLISVAYPTWRIVHNRNLRTVIDSEVRANAKNFLKLCRHHLESNPLLLQLWGSFRRETGWTDEFFTVERSREFVEPTMQSSGVDQTVVSQHYDLVVFTDIVNDKNSMTKEARDKVSDHVRLFSPIIEAGESVMEGTFWDDDDEYGRALRKACPGRKMSDIIAEILDRGGEATFGRWQVFYRRWCTQRTHPKCVVHLPLIPKYTEAYIAEQREDLGGYRFSANFEMEPIAAEFAIFKPEQVERYWSPPLPEGLQVTIIVDPAIAEQPGRGRSRSAITAVAFDSSTRRRYVLSAWAARVGEDALVKRLYDTYEWVTSEFPGFTVFMVGIEDIAFQKIYRRLIRQEGEDRGYDLPMRPIPSEAQYMKRTRAIVRLAASFEQLAWELQRDQVDLIEELEKYPKAATRDLIVTLSYHLILQQQLMRMVYPMWDPERHVAQKAPGRFDRISIGLFRPTPTEDFGYAVLGRHQKVWYLVEEGLVPRGTPLNDIAATLYSARNTWKVRTGHVLVPHTEVELRKDLVRSRLPVKLARAYTEATAPMARLSTLLERDRFQALAYCVHFQREIGLFTWPDKPGEAMSRRPDLRGVRVLGAVHTVLWHEDPPEAQRWKKPDEMERAFADDPPRPQPARQVVSTGYGYAGRGAR